MKKLLSSLTLALLLIIFAAPTSAQSMLSKTGFTPVTYKVTDASFSLSDGSVFKGRRTDAAGNVSYSGYIQHPNGDITASNGFDKALNIRDNCLYFVKKANENIVYKYQAQNGQLVLLTKVDVTNATYNFNNGYLNITTQVVSGSSVSSGSVYVGSGTVSSGNSSSSSTSVINNTYTRVNCSGCGGSGRCSLCSGSGYLNNNSIGGGKIACSRCHSSGTCNTCHGRGWVR